MIQAQQNPIVLSRTPNIEIDQDSVSGSSTTTSQSDTINKVAGGGVNKVQAELSAELKPPVLAESPIETRSGLRWGDQKNV